jgi:hypothetical protein
MEEMYDEFSLVCRIHDRLRMMMASTYFLGLWIESGSGLVFWFEYFIYTHDIYDDSVWILCIWIIDIVHVSGCRLGDAC